MKEETFSVNILPFSKSVFFSFGLKGLLELTCRVKVGRPKKTALPIVFKRHIRCMSMELTD